MTPSDCLRTLTAEELSAVPVPSPEEIRATLRRAGEELREAAAAPKRVVRTRGRVVRVTRPAYVSAGPHSSEILDDDEIAETPIGSGGAARGLPLPSSVEPSLRAGVQDETPLVEPVVLRTTQAGAGPTDRREP